LLAVMPTNRRLEAPATPPAEAAALLRQWGRLHWVRTLLGLLALLILVVANHRR
jgi:Anthrone oxygenase